MKIRLTFKTPDVLDQVDKQVEGKLEYPGNINDIRASLSKWIEFGEYLTVEIDTEKETCIVVPV